ncbi:Trypsin-like peptidase domain-containing protein [Noviherbaspirillum humi]|uniref:Trypsin-like peptidase domain-containing protein n=1 Tax=Noviherbaspirillum humi TaxID=1688639 RepID=A0A239C3E6_9BURK|nr:trypsin-like peptidase domain-containing protein [Noviherbaspirillum humi]SNS14151.1 Trypsin-like peptidase domain-containing protein [Noviherbaspirillum humi]
MRRTPLYSRAKRTPDNAMPSGPGQPRAGATAAGPPQQPQQPIQPPDRPFSWAGMKRRFPSGANLLAVFALLSMLGVSLAMRQPHQPLTQADIDAAVKHTLQNTILPSPAVRAYQTILPSVVRVTSFAKKHGEEKTPYGVGTGVVIVDTGVILTNQHVVQGADRIELTFSDGTKSDATITGIRPEHDLAILQAKTIPDDLTAATMRSTGDLAPGDHVFAVGFPFGIGPSVSAGVVSGLRRQFVSPEGKGLLTNLIQFDAAANPGNSGGPLVTAEGEVVGIVTAILNPTEQRVFVGIGFAVPIENAASAAGMPPF